MDLVAAGRLLQDFVPLVHEVLSVEEEYDEALVVIWIIVAERYFNRKVLAKALLLLLDEDAHVWTDEIHVLVLSAIFVRINVQFTIVQHNKARLVIPLIRFDESLPTLSDLGLALVRNRNVEPIQQALSYLGVIT